MGPGTRDHGTWDHGPWDHGTMGPWDHGTMGPWDQGPGTRDHGTRDHGTMGPWDQGFQYLKTSISNQDFFKHGRWRARIFVKNNIFDLVGDFGILIPKF